jgi:hypothetical protein
MIGAAGTVAAFALAVAATESVLSRRRTQSAAGTVFAVHAVFAAAWAALAYGFAALAPVPVLLFWGGALLVWIGIRLHIESSILLRMAWLVSQSGSLPRAALLARCASENGTRARIDALAEGGFLQERDGELHLLRKGRSIARIVAWLSARDRRSDASVDQV